ncbi:hypothetical protein [Saccharothrix sp. Mg75]|uniref:hypothetical protein n=1 Tax=Saccharothrix sp. Mg75 TaxID=3445357 RepID=UPI003EEAB455
MTKQKTQDLSGMTVAELRHRASEVGVRGAHDMHKDELVRAVAEASGGAPRPRSEDDSTGGAGKGKAGRGGAGEGKGGADKGGEGKAGEDKGGGGKGGRGKGGVRTGKGTSKSLKYSQEITSTDEEPEREGRSLVTTDHDVIRQWAEARDAVPATVPGTEHGDHLGVLRFDFPGYGGDDLRHVEWDEWFATFDHRRLNFIHQEKRSDGSPSTFFRLESPDREDG